MKRLPLARIAGRMFGTPLAMESAGLDVLVRSIGPRILGFSHDDDGEDGNDESVASQLTTMTDDGIAVIDVSGALVAQSSWMNSLCGMTSYPDIAAARSSAMEDPNCIGIVLNIDSPGGEISGLFDLTDRMSADRGTKPVVAAVNDLAASAAYAIAATADQIIIPQAGTAGSIGVLSIHVDRSAADASNGLKYTAVYAGARKNDGNPHEALSEDAYGAMKARVDQINDIFTAAVARDRGMDQKKVQAMQASLYMGKSAIAAGLADSIGTLDDAISAVRTLAAEAANPPKGRMNMKTPLPESAKTPTATEIEEMVKEAQAAGFASAGEIADLCTLAGKPELAASFLSEKKSVGDVRKSLIDARAKEQQDVDPNNTPGTRGQAQGAQGQGTARPWKEVMAEIEGRKPR